MSFNFIKNKKGYTETELMMVFALLALFGVLCFTLIYAGSGAYERLAENRSNKAYARVVLSYIENRVRQGDEADGVMIANSPAGDDSSALVIAGATGIEGEELWIALKDGELVEYYSDEGVVPDEDFYLSIGEIESFDVSYSANTVIITVGYIQDDELKTQSRIITLRSGKVASYE